MRDSGLELQYEGSTYRPGFPIARKVVANPELMSRYRATPAVVFSWVRRLFITGRVGSVKQLQAHLKHVLMADLDEDLLHFYLSENAKDLEGERESFLNALHNRMMEDDVELFASPSGERYQRLVGNVGVLMDAMLTDAIDNGKRINPKDLQCLAKTINELEDADPSYSDGRVEAARARHVKASVIAGGVKDDGRAREVIDNLLELVEGSELEADSKLDKFESRTRAILEDK